MDAAGTWGGADNGVTGVIVDVEACAGESLVSVGDVTKELGDPAVLMGGDPPVLIGGACTVPPQPAISDAASTSPTTGCGH